MTFTDTITGNFSLKSNKTQLDYFDEGVISSDEWSLRSHNKRYEIYAYDLIALEESGNFTSQAPETGVNDE